MSTTPIKRSAVAILATDIVDLLRDTGPLHNSVIRSRIGVASGERFAAALYLAISDGSIERVTEGNGNALRIVGDTRRVPTIVNRAMQSGAALRVQA